jgi:hypothetical protein
MPLLSPGAICTIRQCGAQLWVVVAKSDDGRWRLRSKRSDSRERSSWTARIAGEGDLMIVRETETFEPSTEIEHDGVKHTVARDLGDSVELVTPEVSRPLRGGGALRIAAGNTVTMAKSDLGVGADAITTDLMIT